MPGVRAARKKREVGDGAEGEETEGEVEKELWGGVRCWGHFLRSGEAVGAPQPFTSTFSLAVLSPGRCRDVVTKPLYFNPLS